MANRLPLQLQKLPAEHLQKVRSHVQGLLKVGLHDISDLDALDEVLAANLHTNGSRLVAGQRVQLQNLGDLEGRAGVILEMNDSTGRYVVELEGAHLLALDGSVSPVAGRRRRSAQLSDSEEQEPLDSDWLRLGGRELEGPLRKGWVKLLDAAWLVKLAEQGGTLSRRQDLPPEAFVSVEALKQAGAGRSRHREWLRLLVLSAPWLEPGHPDPHGENLRFVAKVVGTFLSDEGNGGRPYGVLTDFTALPQEPRTLEEQQLFSLAVPYLQRFYAHPQTVVLKVTDFPKDYPDHPEHLYTLPEGANSAAYPDRGWCFAEAAISGLVKDSRKVLDLGRPTVYNSTDVYGLVDRLMAGREPPWHPRAFREELERKSFTNKEADFEKVAQLYSDAFARHLGDAEELDFNCLGWDALAARRLVEALGSNTALTRLNLHANNLGDEGAAVVGELVRNCESLADLNLGGNDVGDKGARALAEVLRVNETLTTLDLTANKLQDEGARALGESLCANDVLEQLLVGFNRLGIEGRLALCEAATARAQREARELKIFFF